MENTQKVKIINNSKFALPIYETPQSSGIDLRANIEEPIKLATGERVRIKTGIHLALPEGYEAQVRSRSGLTANHGIIVLNAPGTIDSDYRGEISVVLFNSDSKNDFVIEAGQRIAQLVIAKYVRPEFVEVDTLDSTERGEGGFGHTGMS